MYSLPTGTLTVIDDSLARRHWSSSSSPVVATPHWWSAPTSAWLRSICRRTRCQKILGPWGASPRSRRSRGRFVESGTCLKSMPEKTWKLKVNALKNLKTQISDSKITDMFRDLQEKYVDARDAFYKAYQLEVQSVATSLFFLENQLLGYGGPASKCI